MSVPTCAKCRKAPACRKSTRNPDLCHDCGYGTARRRADAVRRTARKGKP